MAGRFGSLGFLIQERRVLEPIGAWYVVLSGGEGSDQFEQLGIDARLVWYDKDEARTVVAQDEGRFPECAVVLDPLPRWREARIGVSQTIDWVRGDGEADTRLDGGKAVARLDKVDTAKIRQFA